jgi:hypothetical protein
MNPNRRTLAAADARIVVTLTMGLPALEMMKGSPLLASSMSFAS